MIRASAARSTPRSATHRTLLVHDIDKALLSEQTRADEHHSHSKRNDKKAVAEISPAVSGFVRMCTL